MPLPETCQVAVGVATHHKGLGIRHLTGLGSSMGDDILGITALNRF